MGSNNTKISKKKILDKVIITCVNNCVIPKNSPIIQFYYLDVVDFKLPEIENIPMVSIKSPGWRACFINDNSYSIFTPYGTSTSKIIINFVNNKIILREK